MAFTYAPISPIILPFGLVYFTLGWFVNKFQCLYVYGNTFQAGGKI